MSLWFVTSTLVKVCKESHVIMHVVRPTGCLFYIHVLWQEPVLTLTEQQHAVGEEFKVLVVVTYRTMQMFLTCPFGSWQRISNLVLPFEDLCWEQLFTEGKGNWKLGAWDMCVESSADPQKESSLHLCSLAWAGICDCWVINDLNKFQCC